MAETVRVGSLRGIMMRGPGITQTLSFYEDMWGLSLAHKEDGIALLRGTGSEPFLYCRPFIKQNVKYRLLGRLWLLQHPADDAAAAFDVGAFEPLDAGNHPSRRLFPCQLVRSSTP